jgi:LCP family protein required for cell wall assembly
MARLSDAISCALALALAVLLGGEVRPVVQAFRGENGRLDLSGLARAATQQPPFDGAELVTVLLIGADKRAGDVGRSDTLLVLFLNPQSHHAALLGIPRDLRVTVPGYGRTKINHAYAYGGPKLTQRTVEGLLDMPIDHRAVVFFDGFVQAVDALGGASVDVPDVEGKGRGMNYDDNAGHLHIHLKPGRQHLDGQEALGFVRYRKSNTPGLGDGDTGRSGRQQQLLKALTEQHLNPAGLPGLLAAVKVVSQQVETDMSPTDMTDLARALRACQAGDMLTETVPLRGSNWHGHGAYYAYADEAGFRRALSAIRAHVRAGTPKPVTVEVLNACGIPGRAADASRQLARKGFASAGLGNAHDLHLDRTLVECRPGLEAPAKRAARVLGCGKVRAAGGVGAASGSGADLRVYIGRDYQPAAPS